VVSRYSADSEYRAMTNITCEMVRVRDLLTSLIFASKYPMRLYCDNQAAIHITENLKLHKCIKHIEVDCHLIRQKMKENIAQT